MDTIATIPTFINRDGTIYYQITVLSRTMKTQWIIEKRYSQFDALHTTLSEKFPRVSQLPPKTLMRSSEESYLMYRRSELERFLTDACRRYDISRSEELLSFLEYKREISGILIPKPEVVYEEHIAKPIKDAYLTSDLFVFTQYECFRMYRIDAYLNSLRIPFLRPRIEYLGYTELHTRSGVSLSMKWRANHELLPTALAYSPHIGLVIVGFETGLFHGYLINSDSPHITKRLHTSAIRGLTFSSDSSQLVSLSDDKRMIVFDIASQNPLFLVALPAVPLQVLWWSSQLLVLFEGNMGLFSYGDNGPILDVWLSPESDMQLTALAVSGNVAYLGTTTGFIVNYYMDKRKESGLLDWTGRITAIIHSQGRKELYASNHCGNVAIFSTISGILISVFAACSGEISYLGWDEGESLLFVSGEDRKLWIYRQPQLWDIQFPAIVSESSSIPPVKSIGDDLEGWDR